MNDMCPSYNCSRIMNCIKEANNYLTKKYQIVEAKCCKKYLSEKPESAWKMFRSLNSKQFFKLWRKYYPNTIVTNCKREREMVSARILLEPEQEAIKIIKDVKNE